MRKSIRRSYRTRSIYRPIFIWLGAVLAACIIIRAASVSGVGNKIERRLRELASGDGVAEKIVEMEMGNPLSDNPLLNAVIGTPEESEEKPEPVQETPENDETHMAESSIPQEQESADTEPEEEPTPEESVQSVFGDGTQTLDGSSIELDNKSGYDIDVQALLNSPLGMTIKSGEPSILIVHTHGSESYTPAESGLYEESDPYRTENVSYNVVKVGEVLKAELESYGITVLHDTTLHDYPSYNGSYSRSFETIAKYIDQYPSIKIVIDLHRDAIAKADGSQVRTTAQIGDTTCSQVLLVMGTDASGLSHPVWQENLKLALKMQYAMNVMYPTLAKPVLVSQYRYNQHMTAGSMILEVGCTGNTIEESIQAVKYFADSAGQVLQTITEK